MTWHWTRSLPCQGTGIVYEGTMVTLYTLFHSYGGRQ